ncbi:MAG TPA: enoyl-CoA hydratase/isomerase family protein [Sphingobacteriaceae bacterium]|nr:enoyl-CoA hydratase/isomerase family protein [Sphingobacteriaceae bacterium]
MKHLSLSVTDKMALIGLNRGRSNAINAELLDELKVIFKSVQDDDTIAGVILHGKEGFFSAGLDLIELYNYSEMEIRAFWESFLSFVQSFTAFKKPVVAAIGGHSPAGGCVLALCCDYRIMADGEFIIGLNEVPVGIIVPDAIFHLYSFWIGQAKAYQYLLEGKLLSPEQALKVGLIDELVSPAALRSRAEKQLKKYIQLEANTWQQSKINMRRELISKMSVDPTETLDIMLKQWWSPSTRSILKTIIENLKGGK